MKMLSTLMYTITHKSSVRLTLRLQLELGEALFHFASKITQHRITLTLQVSYELVRLEEGVTSTVLELLRYVFL